MTAHYPTSADLAAMRQDFGFALGADWGPLISPTDPETCEETGRAWPHEREHGIGHRHGWQSHPITGQYRSEPGDCCPINDRREANRQRREAFDRMARYSVRVHDTAALIAAIETFAPVKVSANGRPDRPAIRTIADLDRESRPESESELRFAYGDR